MSASRPAASVLVPTHDHATLLDLAVHSALAQTVTDIEVLVIGDGVGDDTRDVMADLTKLDSRVRFLDFPKGPSHGEVYRGQAIERTSAEIVCYLCDDDLLLPNHVESMVELLADADLAHSLNGYLDVVGEWTFYWGDLSLPASRAWALRPDKNFVSLTGTAHTVSAYRCLPYGWRTTPQGRWPDHYMWEQFLAQPWVRASTATRVTAVQFPDHLEERHEWGPAGRRRELEKWTRQLADPEGRAQFETSVRRAMLAQATRYFLEYEAAAEREEASQRYVRDLELEVAAAEQRASAAERFVAAADELAAVLATRTWRLRTRLLRVAALRAVAMLTTRWRECGRTGTSLR